MRILHTADWHLGQTLHGVSRAWEHERFFAWLLDVLEAERIDALVVAGDVFDTANPSPAAQAQYYGFLAAARGRCPRLDLVVVGGNHDSPDRLDAPRALLALDPIRVTVHGALPRTPTGEADLERALVPLHDSRGQIGAWLLAVPFLRRGDLPDLDAAGAGDPELEERTLTTAYARLYRRLVELALARRTPGQALVATGHCYMIGGRTSDLSERKIQVGNQDALPVDVFPTELAYVALGHLHYAQPVHGRENVRYSGSPIPLSMTERTYEHQVLVVDLEDGWIARPPKKLLVPRAVELWSVPETHEPLDAVLTALRALPRERPAGAPDDARPFVEVKVALDTPSPRLRRDLEEAFDGAFARLARIDVRYPERTEPRTFGHVDGALRPAPRELGALSPSAVFEAIHAKQRGATPLSPELFTLFSELVESVQRDQDLVALDLSDRTVSDRTGEVEP